MKLAIFGASGRTGKPLVRKALAEGHQVRAFVRDPAKLGIEHENLKVIAGDVRRYEDVERAVAEADVVISVLGPTSGSDDVMAVAGENIVRAMQNCGVRRFLTLTGAGVEDPQDEPRLFNRVMSFLLKTTARSVYEQSYRHVEQVRSSGLDWTVVRVPMLTDRPGQKNIRVGYVGKGTGPRINREDVARFLLDEAVQSRYVGSAPMISE